jgi:citrate lyase subunit beta / citryl-CoA lyase
MSKHPTARRSMLIVPAGRQRTVDKAFETDADIIMLDLDDGVVSTSEEKSAARERVVAALRAHPEPKQEVVVRTNALTTAWWEEDLRAVAPAGPTAVVPAKIDTAAQVAEIDRCLFTGCGPSSVEIWPMIESAAAVLNVDAIAQASVRVGALCYGVGDFTVSTQGEFSDDISHLAYALGKVICAARAHELSAIAPAVVWTDVSRLDLLRQQALLLRRLGYDGAMVVTPRHLAEINDVFTPSAETVAWAQSLESAIEKAHRAGQSAVVVDGKLVEIVNLKRAQRTLTIARGLGLAAN